MSIENKTRLAALPWGHVQRENGNFMVMLYPENVFWGLWRSNKDAMKAEGVKVTKGRFVNGKVEKDDNGSFIATWEISARVAPAILQAGGTFLAPYCQAPVQVSSVTIPDGIRAKLMTWQPEVAEKLIKALQTHGAALDLSGTGVGKTFIAIAVAASLGLDPIVVTTAGNVRNHTFEKACAHFGIDNYLVNNWDLVRAGKMRVGKKVMPATFVTKLASKGANGTRFEWHVGKGHLLVLDESQNARNKGTLQTELVQATNDAILKGVKVLLTSATPGENPLKFRVQGEILGLYTGNVFYNWAMQYGCVYQEIPGAKNINPKTGEQRKAFVFAGNYEDMKKLRRELLLDGHVAGKQSSEIPEFPESLNTIDLVDFGENTEKIAETRAMWEATLTGLHAAENDAKWRDADEGGRLMERQKQSQQLELLKTGVVAELARDEIDKGNSAVIFVRYQDTADAYKAEFGDEAVFYTGQQSPKEQVAAREAFQADQHRVIVLSIGSGKASIDLQDLHGNHPRVSFITPDDNAEDIVQSLGRIPRTKGLTKCRQHVIYAWDNESVDEDGNHDGGIEAHIAKTMIEKIKQLDAVAGRKPTISGISDWNTGDNAALLKPEPAPVAEDVIEPRVPARQPVVKDGKKLEPGIYRKDGEIYKVQVGIYGSGFSYAKRLVVDKEKKTAKFEYEVGAIMRLTKEDKMTLDQAKEFGSIYGICCACSRTLTDEDSIEAGIGPICAAKFDR